MGFEPMTIPTQIYLEDDLSLRGSVFCFQLKKSITMPNRFIFVISAYFIYLIKKQRNIQNTCGRPRANELELSSSTIGAALYK